jgi:hypothetical protein
MRYVCRKIGVAAEPCGFEEGLSNRIKFGRAARCGDESRVVMFYHAGGSDRCGGFDSVAS